MTAGKRRIHPLGQENPGTSPTGHRMTDPVDPPKHLIRPKLTPSGRAQLPAEISHRLCHLAQGPRPERNDSSTHRGKVSVRDGTNAAKILGDNDIRTQ